MTKQKEKAPDGDNARVRFALYTDEATLGQVKQNYKQDGCGCMSEYVTNLYFESGIEGKSHFRYLTPRECLLFMGFTDEDYRNIVKCNPEVHKGSVLFPRDKIIRMAGNSIPVKLLEGVFYQILLLDKKI